MGWLCVRRQHLKHPPQRHYGHRAYSPPLALGKSGTVKPEACMSATHAHTHSLASTQPRQLMGLTGGTEALRKAVSGVSALTLG